MAVLIRTGKVLVQERYRSTKGMVFEFPGGSVDLNETGEQAAIRELKEETGLRSVSVLGIHTLVNEFGGDIHYVILEQTEQEEPKVVEAYRKQIFHWFHPASIPRQDFYKADILFIENQLIKYT